MGSWSFLFTALVIAFIGALLENLDRYGGVGVRRWLSDALSKPKLKAPKGFIANCDWRERGTTMVIIYALWLALKVVVHMVAFGDVIAAFFVVPLLVAGSYAGPKLGLAWGRRDRLFKVVDEFSTNPEAAMQHGKDAFRDIFSGPKPAAATAAPAPAPETVVRDPLDPREDVPVAAVSKEVPKAPVPDDHRADLDKFVNG